MWDTHWRLVVFLCEVPVKYITVNTKHKFLNSCAFFVKYVKIKVFDLLHQNNDIKRTTSTFKASY